MPCKSINVVANGKISFLSKSWVVLINTCLLYPFNGWTLRVPMISATVNNTAMNFEVHVPFLISVSMFHFILFGYILRSGLARLPLCFLNGNFWWTEILNFEEVQFLIFFSFSVNAFYILCEKNLFIPQDMIFFPRTFLFHHSHFFCRLLRKLNIFFTFFQLFQLENYLLKRWSFPFVKKSTDYT